MKVPPGQGLLQALFTDVSQVHPGMDQAKVRSWNSVWVSMWVVGILVLISSTTLAGNWIRSEGASTETMHSDRGCVHLTQQLTCCTKYLPWLCSTSATRRMLPWAGNPSTDRPFLKSLPATQVLWKGSMNMFTYPWDEWLYETLPANIFLINNEARIISYCVEGTMQWIVPGLNYEDKNRLCERQVVNDQPARWHPLWMSNGLPSQL